MKSKYDGNDLVDFILSEPMEMREFMDSHNKLNFIIKWLIKFRANF